MKKTTRLLTLMAGITAAFSFSAMAQEKEKGTTEDKEGTAKKEPAAAPEREGRRGRGARRELTEEQRAEMAKQREKMAALRKEHDKDGDGNLNDDERKAYMEAVLVVRFDENGDGKLEGEEKTKAEEARKRFGERGRGPGARRGAGAGRRGGPDGGGRPGPRQAPPQEKP